MTASSVDPLAKSFLQGRSGSLDDALISLCDHVEALASGSIAGLTICNPSRTHIERAVFPRLPQFATAIRAIPLSPSDFGSCVQAIAHGEIITCHDIAEEKRFDPQWQRLCLDHGVRSQLARAIRQRPQHLVRLPIPNLPHVHLSQHFEPERRRQARFRDPHAVAVRWVPVCGNRSDVRRGRRDQWTVR